VTLVLGKNMAVSVKSNSSTQNVIRKLINKYQEDSVTNMRLEWLSWQTVWRRNVQSVLQISTPSDVEKT
jgi:hypothetical protein